MSVDFAKIRRDGGTRMAVEDLKLLYRLVMEDRPYIIIEIGAGGGCSSVTLGLAARETDGNVWSIDPKREGRWQKNIEDYDLKNIVFRVDGPSPWIDCPESGVSHEIDLDDEIDFLLIDGDHRTEHVIIDYMYWQRFVRIGGIIVFHDWCGQHGTWRWIREAIDICTRDGNLELIATTEAPDYGCRAFRKTRQRLPCPQWPGDKSPPRGGEDR